MLTLAERSLPSPGRGEVLVEVHAAGVNRPDVLQRLGKYPPPPGASDLPGLEVAGVVVAKGDGVQWPREGERVCGLLAGGGYAEYVAVPAPQCLPLPRGFTMVEGAALPECVFTVWANVFERGHLTAGEVLLVHGGTSGIGTTAIQMAVSAGARVIATAGSPEKCAACARLGAERAVNYRDEDFVAVARDLTGGRGVDVILDMVGGDYTPRNLEALAIEGRLVQIAFLQVAEGRDRPVADHAAAAHRDGIHVARAQRGREGRAGRRPSREGLAATGQRRLEARRARDLRVRRCGRGASRHGGRDAHRQARADGQGVGVGRRARQARLASSAGSRSTSLLMTRSGLVSEIAGP